jgi:hypothetical protein
MLKGVKNRRGENMIAQKVVETSLHVSYPGLPKPVLDQKLRALASEWGGAVGDSGYCLGGGGERDMTFSFPDFESANRFALQACPLVGVGGKIEVDEG